MWVKIPLIGTVSCRSPILAEENIEAFVSVSTSLAKIDAKYFLLHASGDSMNLAGINDGDLALVRQQPAVENGYKVVALIDDQATIKEFYKTSEAVILKPKSSNPNHQPIILTENFQIQGVVITTISKI